MYECNLTRWCCWWGCVKKHIDDDYPVDIAFRFIRSYMCKNAMLQDKCILLTHKHSSWENGWSFHFPKSYFLSYTCRGVCFFNQFIASFLSTSRIICDNELLYVDWYSQLRIFHLCIFLGKSKSFYYRIIVTESYMCGWYDDACLAVLV